MKLVLPALRPSSPISLRSDLTLKGLNFAAWGAAGLFFPYINVYYRDMGLSGTQIGLIGMLGAGVAGFGAMAWSILSDRLGKTRLLFSLAALGAVLFSSLLGQVNLFFPLLVVATILSLFIRPAFTLVDTTTLGMLGEHKDSYSGYRLWGTLGFIVTSSLGGLALERTGLKGMFLFFPAAMLLFWLVTLSLPNETVRGGGVTPGSGLLEMIRRPAWVVFILAVLLLWTPAMGGMNFFGVVLRDIGGSEMSIGWLSTIAALAEIPLFFYGARVLRRFGPRGLLLLGCGFYAVRMFLFALAPSVGWALALGLLNGLSYVPFLLGAVAYSAELAPNHLKATAQGVLATLFSLGGLTGSLMGGWLYDNVSRFNMYTIFGVGCLLALVVFAVGMKRKES
jgi:PPP family 3-phenylpropionic acid transporter